MEPALRRLLWDFGADLEITYVMGGLAREYEGDLSHMILAWLDASDRSAMPVDPRLWSEAPLRSTYPACMAVKAAAEQGPDAAARYLRALREGIMCFRRRLDGKEALVEEARGAGLDVQRFRVDLDSHAIVEAFGADLEATREAAAAQSIERLPLPALHVEGGDWVLGDAPYADWQAAVLAAASAPAPPGGGPSSSLTRTADPLAVIERFGRAATAEIQAICELPGPRAEAELWRLATEWRLKPVRVLTGTLWEPA